MFNPELALVCAEYLMFLQDRSGKTLPLCEEQIVSRHEIDGIEFALFQHPEFGNVIAFPGYNERSDINLLIDFRYRKRSEGAVFSSLRSAYSKVHQLIDRVIADTWCCTDVQVITGYSLGGVLATFCRLYGTDCTPTESYLFASPRPGDENLSNTYDDRYRLNTYRIAVIGDPITHVPVTGWHVGQPIVFDLDGTLKTSDRDWANQVAQNLFDSPKFLWLSPLVLLFYYWGVCLQLWRDRHDLRLYLRLLNENKDKFKGVVNAGQS